MSTSIVLKIIRRFRTIEVDISTPERFQELKEDCLFALQVNGVLTERARQRRHLVEFLLRNPSPCDCTEGGAAHVRAYYYSSRVSEYMGILPLEFVYKNLSSQMVFVDDVYMFLCCFLFIYFILYE